MTMKNRVAINVSGELFETYEQTLDRFPQTLLGDHSTRFKYKAKNTDYYFFARHRKSFEAILYYYQSYGNLLRPFDVDLSIFESECRFFGIPEPDIITMKLKEGIFSVRPKLKESGLIESSVQLRIWNFLEDPASSKPAVCFAIFTMILITASIIETCLETVIEFHTDADDLENPWSLMELILSSLFLLELLVRFISAPRKIKFIKTPLIWIEFVAVVPYFIDLMAKNGSALSFGFLRIFRIIRILKLFRLTSLSTKLRRAGCILEDCLKDLQLFIPFVVVVVSGANLLYLMEGHKEETAFTSVPQGMWWAIQTLVSLGYGDIVPVTIPGKLFSSFYMVFGALTISLPILSVVMKFTVNWSATERYMGNIRFVSA